MPSTPMPSAVRPDELSDGADGGTLQPARRRRLTEPESIDRDSPPTAADEAHSPGEPGGGYDVDERDYYHNHDNYEQAEIGSPDPDARPQLEPERGDCGGEDVATDDGSAGAGNGPLRRGARVRQRNRRYDDSSDEEDNGDGARDRDDDGESDDYPDRAGSPSETDSNASESDSDNEGASDRLPTLHRVPKEDPVPAGPSDRAGLPRGEYSAAMVEFAAGVTEHNIGMGQADWILDFIARHTGEELSQLPRQYRSILEHNRRWSTWFGHPSLAWPSMPADAEDGLEFHEASVEVDGHGIVVRVRNTWSVLVRTFLQPEATNSLLHLGYSAKTDPLDGSQLYSEMWTGDWWRQEENKLELGQDLLALMFHFDETPFWKRSVAPLFLSLGNLPAADRRRHDMMPVVAYVPKLTGLEYEKGTSKFRRAKRLLVHAVLQYVLQPLSEARERGGLACKVGGYDRVLVPAVAVVVADNEGKATLSLTYKKKVAQMPCQACQIPREELGNIEAATDGPAYPARDVDTMKTLANSVATAPYGLKTDANNAARAASLYPQVNAFWVGTLCWSIYLALVPDLLHDADLGVFKRFVLAIFAWLEVHAKRAADELDRRIRILTSTPLPAVRRFGAGGFRGLERKEGAHLRSVMTVLPLALLNLPAAAGLDLDSLIVLAADWVGLYADLRLPSISRLRLDAWQARAADFGGRLREQLVLLGDGDGVFPKLHALLGGHVHEAVRWFGTVAGYDSAPFEARHRSAVHEIARRASRAVDPLAQMATGARRKEIVQHLGAVAGAVRSGNGDEDDEADEPGLSWAAKHLGRAVAARSLASLDLAAVWPHANVTGATSANAVHKLTANWLAAQTVPHVLSRQDAYAATVEVLRRLKTRDGARAYAHPSFHGSERYDDIAVLGLGGETWYARIVGLARFSFPAGGPKAREGVLVRWYEKAPPAVLADLGEAVRAALAPCPLVYAGKLDWITPKQALRRVGVVPCWFTDPDAMSARPVVSPPEGPPMATYWFINGFYDKIHSANKDLAVDVEEEDEEKEEGKDDGEAGAH